MTVSTTRLTRRAERSRGEMIAIVAISVLSVIGAGIHLYVAPDHLSEWWVYGTFFIVVAAGQLATVPLVARWRRPEVLTALVVANVGVVLIWLLSRTTGLPVGPPVLDVTGGLADPTLGGYGAHAVGVPEPVGRLDFIATLCELGVVVLLCALLPRAWRRWVLNALVVLGALLWLLFGLGALG